MRQHASPRDQEGGESIVNRGGEEPPFISDEPIDPNILPEPPVEDPRGQVHPDPPVEDPRNQQPERREPPVKDGGVRTGGRLFSEHDVHAYQRRWTDIQAGFVDEPRRAVELADGLVSDTMNRLTQVFADERRRLEQQWDRGDRVTTEDLRVALQRYRLFFDRLLTI